MTDWIDRWQYAAIRLRSLWHRELEQAGVLPNVYEILTAIPSFREQGCSQKELATRLVQSESNICALIERMVDQGVIQRARSCTDRRKWILRLTNEGEQHLRELKVRRDRWLRQEFQHLLELDEATTTIAKLLSQFLDGEPVQAIPFEQRGFRREGVAA